MYRTLWLFLLIALLAACGPARLESTQQPLATPSQDWTSVKLTQSGGIMGMLRTIEISRKGSLVATDDRARKSATGQLSMTDLSELLDMVDAFAFAPPSDPDMVCADCFIYTIEISSSSGVATSVQANDIDLLESGMEPLVNFLRGYMEDALK
jgi:hypothetical protein